MAEKKHSEQAKSSQTNDRYEVGYGKPPKDTQFKKGVSGNLKGRPRKKHRLANKHSVEQIFREVFSIEVTANVGGKIQKINGIKATFLQLRAQAIAGDPRALRIFVDLCKHFKINEDPQVNIQLQGLFDALMAGPVDTP